MRKTSEKVSCDGIACFSFSKPLKICSYARPNTAISAQELDPQWTETKAITTNSPKSCRALLARGSGTSLKAAGKICIGGGLHELTQRHRNQLSLRRKHGSPRSQLQKRFPCTSSRDVTGSFETYRLARMSYWQAILASTLRVSYSGTKWKYLCSATFKCIGRTGGLK